MKRILIYTFLLLGLGITFNSFVLADLTFVSWGGAYTSSQEKAYIDTWIKGSGVTVENYNGGLGEIKNQVNSGNVKWDVVDILPDQAIRGCDEGLFEKIPQDQEMINDMIVSPISDCVVPQIFWSYVVFFDKNNFPGKKPKKIKDFFDVKKFPGKRGVHTWSNGLVEMALVADGVKPSKVYEVLSTSKGVERAFRQLDKIRDHVVFWSAGAQPLNLVASGEVVMSIAYNGRVGAAILNEGKNFEYIWDGQVLETEYLAMLKGSKNKKEALEFMKHASSAKSLALQAKYIPYGPMRKSSIDIIKRGEPWYKTGINITKHINSRPKLLKRTVIADPFWWAHNGNDIHRIFSNWKDGGRYSSTQETIAKQLSKPSKTLAKKEFDKNQNSSEDQISSDILLSSSSLLTEEDGSIGTKLKNLAQLYKDGVLDKSQFEKAKKRLLNFENTSTAKSKQPQSFDWIAIAKHPKSNNEFVATRLSTKKKAIDLAMKKCYKYVTNSLGKSGYNDCSLVKAYNEKEKVKTQIVKKESNQNGELTKVINNIERLTPGDYYLFAHSTTDEKFWGSTKATNKTTQKGIAISSSGYSCKIISKQKTSKAPFKGSFVINCPNEKINGSWTQETGYSPGIGQAFTDDGDVITAFFSYKQSAIIDFAKKYYDTKQTKIAKEETIDEFKPKKTNQDNEAPVIKIAKTITVDDASYEIEGKVSDKSNKIFIQVDGRTIPVNKGKFKIKRFSPVDEQISIIATDQWGNSSEPKLVNIIIDQKDSIVAEKIESLDPSKIKSKINKERVALIIGIEKYDQTPEATFANLDAKYFYEYARKGFGVAKSNIKLLVDEDANLVDSLGTINKWLPGKIKDGKTELIIFFAGHGLASNDGKELYLLPQDGDPDLLSRTALSRTELFQEIINLNPKSVTMFLDTCYSGVSRNERTLLASARPVRIIADEQDTPDNFTIFSASQLDQISSGLDGANHGIFSYYLMKGLEGNADINQDKKITNGELLAYMDENVSQKASELGRQQNPSLAGDPDKILMSYR